MERNLTMLTDFYEITMANGYLMNGRADDIAYFDLFYRSIPDQGGYVIAAGLEQAIEYLKTLKFTEEDITYLRQRGEFSEEFFEYLRNFKFECDVWAVPEGTPVFPYEPIVTVRGPIMQAQFVETALLLFINHQSLIATKASRIVSAAEGRPVMEFGTRRAHGADAAILGARAAYIGGCAGTACAIADRDYGIKALGTMAHSWIQSYESEYEAFLEYTKQYPENCTLLVDTYDTLRSGVPNAIKVFDEVKPKSKGIRIDSGDVAYLSKKARAMLDAAGHKDCKIVISNSLDEEVIQSVLRQGAEIDSFGVGERLITSKSEPVLGGVYKLVAVESDGKISPRIKISENIEKITNPGFKFTYRFYDKETGKVLGDMIALADEEIPKDELIIFDQAATWKKTRLANYNIRRLEIPIFEKGKCVYESPDIEEIKANTKRELATLWEESLRLQKPQVYYVDLSEKLYNLKNDMLQEIKSSML